MDEHIEKISKVAEVAGKEHSIEQVRGAPIFIDTVLNSERVLPMGDPSGGSKLKLI